jgi:hypothetical protein
MKALTSLFVVLLACSSSPSPGVGPPTPVVDETKCPTTRDENPYGVCYPVNDLGVDVGQVIPNLCFDDGTLSFCLAQLYDPESKLAARLIHITVMANWVGPSNVEADFIAGTDLTGANVSSVAWAKELSPNVAFINAWLTQTTTSGGGATADFQAWLAAHGDVVSTNVAPGVLGDAPAIPLNIDIDARTMKIVHEALGLDLQLDQSIEKVLSTL